MFNDIAKFDTKNLFSIIKDSWKQADYGWNKNINLSISGQYSSVMISGLGGSAISGDLLRNFLQNKTKVAITINRNYTLPSWVDEKTLFIASSYSGNTEETISALKEAISRKCKIVVITTGGAIESLATEHGIDVVKLQEGFQPRYALYNSFFTLLRVFVSLNLAEISDDYVKSLIDMLKECGEIYSRDESLAFEIAKNLQGSVPVIYTTADCNDAAGRRFKGQLNENSKVHAWWMDYPEMNHNEIVGWETFSSSSINYKVVNILDKDIHPRVLNRFKIINNLLSDQGVAIINIESNRSTFGERLLECVYLCDWISYYLAILNKKDPGEIDFIHHLKKKMSEV